MDIRLTYLSGLEIAELTEEDMPMVSGVFINDKLPHSYKP
jgi:hypothetical protein